ncbi:dpoa decarboxylase [Klebsiella michiganensis]|uniref:dpoa decarboxylase n=1 Tax=Klebsiella michiganensis TaxID=1134687 RepID=UPI003DA9D928
MNKEDRFIDNIHSKNQDRISVDVVYRKLAEEANHGCGLYYEIYESRFIGLLRHHLSLLNEPDAEKLRRYAESQGMKADDETYREALNAEWECRAEIVREQM